MRCTERPFRIGEPLRQGVGEGERVVPEGVDLHGISVPGCDGHAPHGRVHPGEGGPSVAGVEEAPLVHPDREARSVHETADDPLHHGPEAVADQVGVARDPEELLDGPKVEKRAVDGVVGLGFSVPGEEVGEEPVPFVAADFGEDRDPFSDPAGAEGETGEGDQGVPAPAPEPGVTGDDGRSSRRGRDEKLAPRAEQGEEKLPVVGGIRPRDSPRGLPRRKRAKMRWFVWLRVLPFPVSCLRVHVRFFIGTEPAARVLSLVASGGRSVKNGSASFASLASSSCRRASSASHIAAGSSPEGSEETRRITVPPGSTGNLDDPREEEVLMPVEAPLLLLGIFETVVPEGRGEEP